MPSTLPGGLIGCGSFAINHLHAWRDIAGVEIVAICDRDPARLAALGSQFGIARQYTDAAAMLAAEALGFVDIATAVPSHRSLVELAARHRLPVICQKPFAATMADARAMVDACATAGVPLMVHENFRWQHPIRQVRAVIDAGGPLLDARLGLRIDPAAIHAADVARHPLQAVAARPVALGRDDDPGHRPRIRRRHAPASEDGSHQVGQVLDGQGGRLHGVHAPGCRTARSGMLKTASKDGNHASARTAPQASGRPAMPAVRDGLSRPFPPRFRAASC